MTAPYPNQPRMLSSLRTIRQMAEDRNDAERLKEVAGALRRIAMSSARIKAFQVMRVGSDSVDQASILVDLAKRSIPLEPTDLVTQTSELIAASDRIRILEAAACRDLAERVRTYKELSRKFQLHVATSDLELVVGQFIERQIHAGPLGPQLAEVGALATRMTDLHYDVTAPIMGHLKAIFGPNVDINTVRQLMGDGVSATVLKPAQLQRLLGSKVAHSLVIRLK